MSCAKASVAIAATPGQSIVPRAPRFMSIGSSPFSMSPVLASRGASTPYAQTAPKSTEMPVRAPMSAPPPSRIGSILSPNPSLDAARRPSAANTGGFRRGGNAHVATVTIEATTAAFTSVRIWLLALPASANMLLMVSAVAVPEGNLSASALCTTKCARSGAAKKTPRYATAAPHAAMTQTECSMPSICSAGMGPISPAAMVMDPAADAVVWQMFASSSVNGRAGAMAEKSPMLTTAEITLPPCAQPALSPNDTFMALTTTPTHIPATTARALRGSVGPGPAIATRV
mmetsp:Transcript_5621/g.23810  ORF Transcript_5621/g.23810 Transcript_5621/m.23810 type:complete len:287 (+) Transcript_5621:1325-2185(+)